MNNKAQNAVLGVFVTPQRIEAVLAQASDEAVEIVGHVARQRLRKGEGVGAGSLVTSVPGLRGAEDADFTIQVGGGGDSTSPTFLSTEFTGLGAGKSANGQSGPVGGRPVPFPKPLREILAECHRLGYESPRVAFCASAPEVTYVELFVSRDQLEASGRKTLSNLLPSKDDDAPGVDRRLLLDLLKAQHRSGFDEARVVFLPMTPLKGQRRYLALVPESSESVTPTLRTLFEQQKHTAFSPETLGTELSLYAALARQSLKPAPNENTAVVRVGGDDTLLLFLTGTELRHVERLRSLSTYDPPETICSRVLLQQDEQKIGEVHHVLVLSEARDAQFLDAFRKFYPNAAIEPVQDVLSGHGVHLANDDPDGFRANVLGATTAAVQVLRGWEQDDPFAAVNLLPKKLRRRPKQRFAFAWHTFAMLAVLFAVTLFFTLRYAEQAAEIDRSRAELMLNPVDPSLASPAVVRARVDSLQRVYQQYERALYVLDSLLVGSDQWSRTLEKTSRATLELPSVWFDSWQPNGSQLRIQGNARSQRTVAQLAYRLDGEVESFNTEDVNDQRIHPFTMVVPRPIEMPKVAEYLKDRVELGLSIDTVLVSSTTDGRAASQNQ